MAEVEDEFTGDPELFRNGRPRISQVIPSVPAILLVGNRGEGRHQ